ANTLPLDANYIVNTKAEISGGGDETLDVNVNVGINGDFENEPKPAVFEVGSYVDAAGKATNEKDAAVGVVYHLGAIDGDDASLYPSEFAGKTIKGYVVALENTSAARAQLNAATITDGFPPAETLMNGTQNEGVIFAGLGESAFVTAWNAWTAAHALEANGNITAWYLPARIQMEAWISMLLPTTNLKNETLEVSGSEAFRALFPLNTIFDRDPFQNCMYATSSVNSGGNIQGTSLTADGDTGTVKFAQIDVKTKTQSVLGRAMFTVFE
ncbi:MAG: hypothetical protein K2G30_00410, partial [Muribaculaceae bacterium]|nr:hypothetical protein [Muribaculaceae bacterium]